VVIQINSPASAAISFFIGAISVICGLGRVPGKI